jgi:hypothetical protein
LEQVQVVGGFEVKYAISLFKQSVPQRANKAKSMQFIATCSIAKIVRIAKKTCTQSRITGKCPITKNYVDSAKRSQCLGSMR